MIWVSIDATLSELNLNVGGQIRESPWKLGCCKHMFCSLTYSSNDTLSFIGPFKSLGNPTNKNITTVWVLYCPVPKMVWGIAVFKEAASAKKAAVCGWEAWLKQVRSRIRERRSTVFVVGFCRKLVEWETWGKVLELKIPWFPSMILFAPFLNKSCFRSLKGGTSYPRPQDFSYSGVFSSMHALAGTGCS